MMRNISILGTTGCGKSTLARNLAAKLDLRCIDLDDHYWLPNWVGREPADFRTRIEALLKKDGWVCAGNYRTVSDLIRPKADTLIWLDYAAPLIFWRLLSRSFRRITDQNEICNGNTEKLGKFFSKDSIILWFIQSHPRRKKQNRELFNNPAQYPHITFLRFKTPRQTRVWLESL